MSEVIKTETVKVSDSGFEYEVDFLTCRNTPKNIANGGKEFYNLTHAFRLKKDGSRGLALKNLNARICEIAKKARV